MDTSRFSLGQWFSRTGVAVAAAACLVSGAWYLSAAPGVAAQSTAAPATSVARAIAGGRDSYADIVKLIAPSVVTIRVEGKAGPAVAQFQFPGDSNGDFFRRFFGDPGDRDDPSPAPRQRAPRQRGLGSGVIVSADGYILTNNHVVDSADNIRVEMTDGRTLVAALIGTDKPSDLALIRVNATGLRPALVGNSDGVQVGDVVLAVGNPLGVGQTVTMGIISAKGRSTRAGNGSYEDFLQTDAPINQGNSGGALVNTKGELVGINSQILSNGGEGNIGIGFAIPSNMAKHVMDELRTNGKVTRAQLGVVVQGVTSDLAESLSLKDVGGALIGSVTAGSAADRAGLKRGDVIMSFNGQPVRDTNTLRNHVAETAPGSTADVTIVRDGKEQHVSVKLDEAAVDKVARRDPDSGSVDQAALGVSVAPLTPELASRYKLPRDVHGLVVQDVDPNGRAADAGVESGDVIEEVNRQSVQSVEDLRAALRKSTDRPVLLLVNRQGSGLFVTVRPNNG